MLAELIVLPNLGRGCWAFQCQRANLILPARAWRPPALGAESQRQKKLPVVSSATPQADWPDNRAEVDHINPGGSNSFCNARVIPAIKRYRDPQTGIEVTSNRPGASISPKPKNLEEWNRFVSVWIETYKMDPGAGIEAIDQKVADMYKVSKQAIGNWKRTYLGGLQWLADQPGGKVEDKTVTWKDIIKRHTGT